MPEYLGGNTAECFQQKLTLLKIDQIWGPLEHFEKGGAGDVRHSKLAAGRE